MSHVVDVTMVTMVKGTAYLPKLCIIMECEVRISRVQGVGKYHTGLVSLEDNESIVQLVCLLKNHIAPVKITISDKCIRRIIDTRVDVGMANIQMMDYNTLGINEIYIKNSKPCDLKDIIKRIRTLLPKITASPLPSSAKRCQIRID